MEHSYVFTKFSEVINITEIVTIHYYEFDQNFVFSGESHDFWEIVYVDSGTVEIQQDDKTILLRQGEILFHEPNEFHAIKSYKSSPNIFVISFVCKSAAMNCFKKFKSPLNNSLKPLVSSIIIESGNTYVIPKNDISLKKLTIKDDAPIGGEHLVKTYLEQLLIILMRELSAKKEVLFFPSRESMETHFVSEIKEFLKSNITEKITMKDICNHFGYSKTNLSIMFKTQCNVSLIKYYNMQKIEHSKKLLRENKYNITQVSDILSFDNPQYFARVFKRVTGLSPTEFIKSLNINS